MRSRSLYSPYDRPVTNTAYAARDVQVDTSVGGSRTEELGARLGVTVGLGRHGHLQANVAHAAFGVVNVGTRFPVVESGRIAVAANATLLVARPRWMWYLPKPARQPLRQLTLVNLPLSLTGTYRATDWLLTSVSAGYDHSSVGGEVRIDSVAFDGVLGARRLWARPTFHLLLSRVVTIEATALVPLAAWGLTDAEAEAEVAPGVRVGVHSQEWRPIPALPGALWQVTSEVRTGRFRLRLGISGNPVLRRLGVPCTPYLGVRWAR